MTSTQRQHVELVFLVEDAEERGSTARALGAGLFTEAGSREELIEAVRCNFDNEAHRPKTIRLQYKNKEHFPCVVPG